MAEITTYKTAARDTYNANTETSLKRDCSSIMFHINESRMAPLNTLTGGDLFLDGESKPQSVKGIIKKEKCVEYKFEILEKSSLNREWTSGAAVADTTTTTIPVAATTGLQAGMLLREKNKDTPEIVFVAAVTLNTSITARRNLGATEYTVPAAAVWECIGWAQAEGGDKRDMRSQIASARTGYLQIFKNTFGITKTLLNSDSILDQSFWEEEMITAKQQHQFDKEFSFMFGPNADSTTDASSQTVYLTRGLLAVLAANDQITNCNGTMTELDFINSVSNDAFAYGSNKKLLICDASFIGKLNSFAWVRQQLRPRENSFGFSISELEVQHGVYNILCTGLFAKHLHADEAGFAVVVDPNELPYKYLQNMDGIYEEKIQTPGASRQEAQFESQVGIFVRKINNHRIIKNIGA